MAESFAKTHLIKSRGGNPMTIDTDKLIFVWNLEDNPACDKGMMLAQTFLKASRECVSNLGLGRTSGTRAGLLIAYNAMVKHADECLKCTTQAYLS
jgi:hypothetical protein